MKKSRQSRQELPTAFAAGFLRPTAWCDVLLTSIRDTSNVPVRADPWRQRAMRRFTRSTTELQPHQAEPAGLEPATWRIETCSPIRAFVMDQHARAVCMYSFKPGRATRDCESFNRLRGAGVRIRFTMYSREAFAEPACSCEHCEGRSVATKEARHCSYC